MPLYPLEATTTRFSQGGANLFQYAVIDANGYPQYNSGAIAQGQAKGMLQAIGAKRVGGQAPAPRSIDFSGDNGYYRAKILVPPQTISVLPLQFSVYDMGFHAYVTNTKIRTIGQWNVQLAEHNARITGKQICVIENMDVTDADTGSFGPERYANWIYPVGYVFPIYGNAEEAQPTNFEYQFAPTQVTKYPWGEQYSVANEGATRAVRDLIMTYYPLTMDTFIADGNTTVFSVSWTPASDFTGSAIRAYRNGSPLAGVTSVNRVITLPTSGVAGDVNVIVYEAVDILAQ